MNSIMNVSLLISLLERIVELYDTRKITSSNSTYSPELTSLMGDIKDALSNVE